MDRSLTGYEGLIAAQECIPNNALRDAFAADFSVLARIWEALSPDPVLTQYETDYRWLAQVYESLKPSSGTGRLLWHRLGAKTIELIHKNVHVDAVRDDLDTLVLDAGLLEAILGNPDPDKKAKEISIKLAGRPGNVHSADGWRNVLEPVVMRYKERKVRLYFRGDAAFASPEIYEYLEAEGLLYVIRLKANAILQRNIAHLLTRPVGRPPDHVRRFHASFSYQAGSWNKKRRVVAKVEWHPGELVPRVGFIVTNLSRPTKRVVAFYNHRGTAEQHIKEGKNAINWTRLSCRKFRNNAVRLQLHALAYNLGNFMRTLALPKEVEHWSMTTLRDKLVKIGAKVVRHGRYVTFQLAEVAVPRDLFRKILSLIDDLRRRPAPA